MSRLGTYFDDSQIVRWPRKMNLDHLYEEFDNSLTRYAKSFDRTGNFSKLVSLIEQVPRPAPFKRQRIGDIPAAAIATPAVASREGKWTVEQTMLVRRDPAMLPSRKIAAFDFDSTLTLFTGNFPPAEVCCLMQVLVASRFYCILHRQAGIIF